MKISCFQFNKAWSLCRFWPLAIVALGLTASRLAADTSDPTKEFSQPLAGSPGSVEYPSNVGVYVWAEALSSGSGSVGLNAASEIYWHKDGTNVQNTSIAMNTAAGDAGQWVSDGSSQWLPITTEQAISYHDISGSNASRYRFHVVAPSGYEVYFYDEAKQYFVEKSVFESDFSTPEVLFIVKRAGETGAVAGKSGDIMPGGTNLRIGLGFLPDGQSAGYLDFDPIENFGATDALGSYFLLYSQQLNGLDRSQYRFDLPGRLSAPFYCYATSDQVKLVFENFTSVVGQANRRIRQILTPQAFVDIIRANDGAQNTVNFYPASAATPDGNGGYTASGSPYVSYSITTGGQDQANWSCSITRTEGTTSQTASIVNEPTYNTINIEQTEQVWQSQEEVDCHDEPIYATVDCEDCSQEQDYPYSITTCEEIPQYDCASDPNQVTGYVEGNCTTTNYDDWEPVCVPATCLDEVGVQQVCDYYEDGEWVTQTVTVPYTLPGPRSTMHVTGFDGSHDETGVSYNSLFPATTHFNGDFYQASHSGSSMKLVGRYGGGRYTHNDDPNNVFTTPDFTSTYETVFDMVNDALDFDALDPDFANGAIGYTTHRKYYDVFNFDPNADRYPGRVFYEERPDRSWTEFAYYTDQAKRGLVSEIVTPFGDTARPSSLPDTSASGYGVQTIDYAQDWNGAYRLPSHVENWVNGTKMSVSTYAYSALQNKINGQPIWQTIISDYATDNSTQVITRTAKVYQGDDVDPAYRGKPYSVQAADGSKQCYAYEWGTFNASDGTFTADANGSAFRTTVVNGSSATGGTATLDGCSQTIDAITLMPNVSTREVTIRDERGLLVRSEKWIYDGSGWDQLEWETVAYDAAGHVIQRRNSNGALYEAEYTDVNGGSTDYNTIAFGNSGTATGRKQYEKDERGIITKYTYDSLGRVQQVLQLAIPASPDNAGGLPQLRARYTYDSDGRVVEKQVGEDDEELVSTYSYDFSGRLTSKTEEGQTTGYAYNLQNGEIQSATETQPDGTTITTVTNRDGTVQSKTGTALVPCYYSYSLNGNRVLATKFEGTNNSLRWSKTWTDGLGRTMEEQLSAPASVGGYLDTVYTYNEKGQRTKVRSGGLAPTLYVYDSMGRLTEKGTDLDGDGQLDGSDRMVSLIADYRQLNGAWWAYSESQVYTDNNTSGTVVNKSWTRETNFGSVVAASSSQLPVTGQALVDVIKQDTDGNQSESTVFVNRDEGNQTGVDTNPLAGQPAIVRSVGGVPVEELSNSGVLVQYEFDPLLRVRRIYDRTRSSSDTSSVNFTYVSGQERIQAAYDDLGHLAASYTYDAAGRVRMVQKPRINYSSPGQPAAYDASVTTSTCYQYNQRGQLTHTWGDDVYPVKYEYDGYGDLITQRTYRNFGAWTAEQPALGSDPSFWPSGGDLTTFTNYPETGLVETRTDAQNHQTQFVYNSRGDVTKRTSARGIEADYNYDSKTGNLLQVTYSDGTPSVTYTYNRLGQVSSVQDASGYRQFTFRSDLLPDQENFGYDNTGTAQSSIYGTGLSIRCAYGSMNSAQVTPLGFDIYDGSSSTYSYRIALNPQTGRLASITTDAGTYNLGYLANSDLLTSINSGSWSQTRSYEDHRDLATSIKTVYGAGTIAGYAYQNDALGRRYQITQTGQVFLPYVPSTDSLVTQLAYNVRSEVMDSATVFGSSGTAVKGRRFSYAYDDAGNRTQETVNGTTNTYTPNELNQYTSRQTPGTIPVSGTTAAGATVSINGSTLASNEWQNLYFYRDIAKNPASGGLQSISYSGTLSGQTYANTAYTWVRPSPTESFTYDADGNLTSDGLWTYSYDGEDRLTGVYSQQPDETGQRIAVLFTYDYQNRRVEKQVYNYNGTITTTCRSRRLYVYNGSTLVAEYDASVSTGARQGLVRTCTWGPDLSGEYEGAGGVGGLLAMKDFRSGYAGVYQAAYDGNGNLTALTSATTGAIQAAYEYDAYGNVVRSSGSYAQENPFRFSTKYQDAETGLIYYGERYYSPSLGRFINQDPIGEAGGLNLYGFCANNPANGWDYLGMDGDGFLGGIEDWGVSEYWGTDPAGGISIDYSWWTGSSVGSDSTYITPDGMSFDLGFSYANNGSSASITTSYDMIAADGSGFSTTATTNYSICDEVWFESSYSTATTDFVGKTPSMSESAPSPSFSAPAARTESKAMADSGSVYTDTRVLADAGLAALQGAKEYVTGLGEGAWGAIKGFGEMFAHPIKTTQNLADGLGTFAGNFVENPSETMAEVGHSLATMANDPHQIGNAVGNFVGGAVLGEGLSGGLGLIGRSSRLLSETSEAAADVNDAAGNVSADTGSLWKRTQVNGARVYQRSDLIDPKLVDDLGRTNLQRMEKGLAPIGPDGEPINLHHMLQTQDGPLAEMTQTVHQENYRTIHINDNSIPSGIDRPAFNAWKRNYWKTRAADFKP